MKQFLTLLLLTIGVSFSANADPHSVYGLFANEGATSHIEISDCGDGSPCGHIVWIDPASLGEGQSPETLLTRTGQEPVLGLKMLYGFKRGRRNWRNGTIFSPPADRTYGSRLKLLDNGSLEVKGCVGPICQTQIWTPVASKNS